MIRKLGYIMLVIAMTLGQPLTVFANTVKDGSQNDSLENNLEMTDVSVAEGFLSELADGNADRYEERQWIEDDQPSTATEENISTNGSGEHTETDSGIEADSSESSSVESSSEATLGCHTKANQKKFQGGMCQKCQEMLMEFSEKKRKKWSMSMTAPMQHP
ncbi:hypothetical protein [Enterococcus casseliflavus]|uniref:hypothetical protein n=1 Tax=Enterococcus casseliflavus TaxID=37734 RepID=UPI001F19D4A2|nr:hypothetical protein [Enterococcus casseliflavus]